MRLVGQRRVQRPLDCGSNLIVVDGSMRPGLVNQAITATLQEPAAPLADGIFVDADFGSHGLAWASHPRRAIT
jgi:hypothetical protein